METALAVLSPDRNIVDRMTPSQIKTDHNLILQVMESVMKKGMDYGTIPGCGDKPTLFKPGAEKLMMTFRLSAKPIVEDLGNADEIRYRVSTEITHAPSGMVIGWGVGEASSNEDKYKWRKVINDAEWDATAEDRKRIKYGRYENTRQVRTNPADIANTILKMADKRSLVSGTLKATAASSIFSQDLEDLSEDIRQAVVEGETVAAAETIQAPKAKEAAPAPVQSPAQVVSPAPAQSPARDRMRKMPSRFGGQCPACSESIAKESIIYYDGGTKKAYHEGCIE